MANESLVNAKDISLAQELTKIIEAGIERQLAQSILYSPFRLFLRLFKSKNPQIVQRVRDTLTSDIENIFAGIEGFKIDDFIQYSQPTKEGQLLIKRGYNIGIRLVKKLNVKMAFRAMRDPDMQQQIYNYILKQVKEKTEAILEDY